MINFCDMIDNEKAMSKFEKIYHKYRNTMYYVAYSLTKNAYDAEDIVEDSLVKVIEMLHKIDEDTIDQQRCKNLMITIAKNTAVDFLRKMNHEAVPLETIEDTEFIPLETGPEEMLIKVEDYKNLAECINKLGDIYKDVLYLRIFHQLSSKEVAKILNVSEANINTRLKRAKRMLYQMLKEYD